MKVYLLSALGGLCRGTTGSRIPDLGDTKEVSGGERGGLEEEGKEERRAEQ